MSEITHKFDPDYSCLEFFVDGELFCTWTCEDQSGLRESVKTFNKIYKLGKSEADSKYHALRARVEALSRAVELLGDNNE